jgi:hypothetical protein
VGALLSSGRGEAALLFKGGSAVCQKLLLLPLLLCEWLRVLLLQGGTQEELIIVALHLLLEQPVGQQGAVALHRLPGGSHGPSRLTHRRGGH